MALRAFQTGAGCCGHGNCACHATRRARPALNVSRLPTRNLAALSQQRIPSERLQDKICLATQSQGYAVMEPKGDLKPYTLVYSEPLGVNEIDIKVTHNGLCGSDISMKNNSWGISKYPFIPGHEAVGQVVAKGSAVQGVEIGDRMGVGWIRNSCRKCLSCIKGEENVCRKGYTGTIVAGNNGGFQHILRVPADFAYKIPDGLDSAHAAPLLCAGVTVYAPLKRHITSPGQKVAILGVGGLGHLAIQFASKMGMHVTGIDVAAEKAHEAHDLGAQDFKVFDEAVANPEAAYDLVLNCASGRIPADKLLALLQPDGTLVQVGIPGGDVMSVPLQNLVFGQKKVVGSIVGGRADMVETLKVAAMHGIKPMIEMMKLSQVNEAMERVKEGKVRYRVVMTSD